MTRNFIFALVSAVTLSVTTSVSLSQSKDMSQPVGNFGGFGGEFGRGMGWGGPGMLGPFGGGIGYFPQGNSVDRKITPAPSGKMASRGETELQHIDDELSAIAYEIRKNRILTREVSEAEAIAITIRATLSGEALAKHDAEYTRRYAEKLRNLHADFQSLRDERSELLEAQRDIFKKLAASQGYAVMTPDERTKATAEKFTCGDGEQSVSRTISTTEYACLSSDGFLTKSAVALEGELLERKTYVRENGKLVRVVTENDGAMVSEITFQDGQQMTKFFSRGAEVASCTVPRASILNSTLNSSGPNCKDCVRSSVLPGAIKR